MPVEEVEKTGHAAQLPIEVLVLQEASASARRHHRRRLPLAIYNHGAQGVSKPRSSPSPFEALLLRK